MPFRATAEFGLMSGEKKTKVSRKLRVTVTIEEVKAPKLDIADESPGGFSTGEVEEFLGEADYSQSG
jgi:hypothetical protein